ncbi:MAG: S8 family serine peptidase [Bacteroidota bacterium]
MILYNLLIFAFGFWNVFKKNKSLSPIFGLGFIAALALSILSIYNSQVSADEKILQTVAVLLGLGVMGFILIALSKNKLAQIGAVIMAAVGFNMYVSNPHTPIDPNIRLDEQAELLIRLDHDKKEKLIKKIEALNFVAHIDPLLSPTDANSTELDDYVKVDVVENYDINLAIADIHEIEGIEWIEPNELLELKLQRTEPPKSKTDFAQSVNDPLSSRQWNMEVLNMGAYYELFKSGKYRPQKTARLFILDSGVNAKHEDLRSNFASHVSQDRSANESDVHGHGTHCAGVAAATTNNGMGIASMNPGSEWVTVSSVKVMNNFGFGSQARIIEGIIEAVDAGADVISMSIGGKSTQLKEEAYYEAIQYADDHGVIIVAAAGNNAGDAAEITPANSEKIITVAALDRQLKKAQFSNYITNTNYGVAAPGVSITSPWKGGRYAAFDGTSMAAPHVSGLVAVMRSLDAELTTKRAYEILHNTGKKTQNARLTGNLIQPVEAIKSMR